MNRRRVSRMAPIVAVVALLAAGGVVLYWMSGRAEPENGQGDAGAPAATDAVASHFYVSLAALDVEENERAARELRQAVSASPEEPALWANLAVAQVRLNELQAARQSLETALRLAPDSRELALLNAELLAHSGEPELAIDQLREVHRRWPENIAATYTLVTLLAQIRSDEAEAERLSLLDDILQRAPGNLQALSEKARIAARLEDHAALTAALDALRAVPLEWPEPLSEQLDAAVAAAQEQDFRQSALSMTFFQNLLKPQPVYQESLVQLGAASVSAIGTPLRQFLRLRAPSTNAAEPDLQIAFQVGPLEEVPTRPQILLAIDLAGEDPFSWVSVADAQVRIGDATPMPYPGHGDAVTRANFTTGDVNGDFRQDVICAASDGVAVYLAGEEGGWQHREVPVSDSEGGWVGVWASDVDADGDTDLLVSDGETALLWLRNDGQANFERMPPLVDAERVRDVCCVDIDSDGDLDLIVLDQAGAIGLWRNDRNGNYAPSAIAQQPARAAFAVGDATRDGRLDIVSLGTGGEVLIATMDEAGLWSESPLAGGLSGAQIEPGVSGFVAVADMDNNGAIDILASAGQVSRIWLGTAARAFEPVGEAVPLGITSLVDANQDGLLDMAGMDGERAVVGLNQSDAGYGWQRIQPVANANAGDRRINSFGVGGRIDVRAGNVVQTAPILSPRVHFGLGNRPQADLAHIVWPNGTNQAEFDFEPGQPLVASQRLKGSCPWLFAFDGDEYRFIKDFIWRSPLGLRINAQTTAGVMQTEDWVKIPGELVAPRDGYYSIRITAELWETHFFDSIEMLAVDHPADVVVLVDERFVPTEMPEHRVIVATHPQPLDELTDHRGESIESVLATQDGVYAESFALGSYQGVAEEHWVEFSVPEHVDAGRPVRIVANGWIYPTDSSLNVAIAQTADIRPYGLILEQWTGDGQWRVIDDNLGFPAGKNKEMVITIPDGAVESSRRFRLRTNMEVYWDSLAWCYEVPGPSSTDADQEPSARSGQVVVDRLRTAVAELDYRGFSELRPVDRRRPDTPVYQVARRQPLWMDLEGYYTRFGDVRELISGVDDRYVIMNAGDELRLEFAVAPPPPEGWTRDFILIGDGWVKDGDFNTAYSQTVRPLPSHEDPEYAGPLTELTEDPVYLRHHEDWQRYHTRYITPRHFIRQIWQAGSLPIAGDVSQ